MLDAGCYHCVLVGVFLACCGECTISVGGGGGCSINILNV